MSCSPCFGVVQKSDIDQLIIIMNDLLDPSDDSTQVTPRPGGHSVYSFWQIHILSTIDLCDVFSIVPFIVVLWSFNCVCNILMKIIVIGRTGCFRWSSGVAVIG